MSTYQSNKAMISQEEGRWSTVEEAAKFLNKSTGTIRNWCEEGKLTYKESAYGTRISLKISVQSLVALRESKREEAKVSVTKIITKQSHYELIPTFLQYCEKGMHNDAGRPYSPETLRIHKRYLNYFLKKHLEASYHTLKAELLELPVENFGKRQKIVRVLISFVKWLVQEDMFDQTHLDKMMKIRVKRVLPAKQVSLKDEEIDLLINACKNSLERLLVIGLSETGLRNSEFRTLTLEKLDLVNREIKTLGKGNKLRWIGLTNKATEAFKAYIEEYGPFEESEPLFKDKFGNQMQRFGLRQRLADIGERVGIEVYPHCLRRSFVTNNVCKGKNLVHLQLLCGHADVQTTRGYCMTTQEEAVDMIKDW